MSTKKIAELGILLGISIVLSYLESLLPVFIAVPGVKLGLANMVSLLVLYQYGGKSAFLLCGVRVFLTGFLFSGMAGIIYGLAGGMSSITVMLILKKISAFSMIGVSIAGAITHNLFQIIVACILMDSSAILYYFPVLVCSGILAGFAIGYLGYRVLKHYRNLG